MYKDRYGVGNMIKINKIGYRLLPTTVGNVFVRPSVKIKTDLP